MCQGDEPTLRRKLSQALKLGNVDHKETAEFLVMTWRPGFECVGWIILKVFGSTPGPLEADPFFIRKRRINLP